MVPQERLEKPHLQFSRAAMAERNISFVKINRAAVIDIVHFYFHSSTISLDNIGHAGALITTQYFDILFHTLLP